MAPMGVTVRLKGMKIRKGAKYITVRITNESRHVWSSREHGAMALGNHWLDAAGAMLIQDDGRVSLPPLVTPGETCVVTLPVTVPVEAAAYQLECDLVHEGITWFADRGSEVWRSVVITSAAEHPPAEAPPPSTPTPVESLPLPAMTLAEDPGPLPMHGIHRPVVEYWVRSNGGAIVDVEEDERSGPEWVGYRYVVRKI